MKEKRGEKKKKGNYYHFTSELREEKEKDIVNSRNCRKEGGGRSRRFASK